MGQVQVGVQESRIPVDLLLDWASHLDGFAGLYPVGMEMGKVRCGCFHEPELRVHLPAKRSRVKCEWTAGPQSSNFTFHSTCFPFPFKHICFAAHDDNATDTKKLASMSSDSRISPYSLPDLKNTTDDALGNYLRGLNFRQDNSKLDFRLIIGYIAVVIAAATFVADYKLGWEATKVWTALAVAVYTVLNGVFTFWLYFVEAGLVFEGAKGEKKV